MTHREGEETRSEGPRHQVSWRSLGATESPTPRVFSTFVGGESSGRPCLVQHMRHEAGEALLERFLSFGVRLGQGASAGHT